jgi:hypothetical protein
VWAATPEERARRRAELLRLGLVSESCLKIRRWSLNRWPETAPPRIVPDSYPRPALPSEACACGRRFYGRCSSCYSPADRLRAPRAERRAGALERARDHFRREEVEAWARGAQVPIDACRGIG